MLQFSDFSWTTLHPQHLSNLIYLLRWTLLRPCPLLDPHLANQLGLLLSQTHHTNPLNISTAWKPILAILKQSQSSNVILGYLIKRGLEGLDSEFLKEMVLHHVKYDQTLSVYSRIERYLIIQS